MQMADPLAFSLPGNESTKKLESRSQYLNSLEKLILPVYLLETDDVDDLNEFPRRTDPTRPQCSK